MTQTITKLTLQEFLALPEGDVTCELINGEAVPKMSPKRFHASLQAELLAILRAWCAGDGFVYPEWAIALQRNGEDWCPVPDLTYISANRLPPDVGNEACPVPPELAIEIMSEGQAFKQFIEKAADYLNAGVDRVWIVDPVSRSITVFFGDRPPQTYTGSTPLTDWMFANLELTALQVFQQAGI
ncbi:Uma2 family endonuclease [Tumidithrix elongata]